MIEYTLREHPRARRINITVRRDGSVFVTKPRRVSARDAERFVRKCEEWIEEKKERFAKLPKTSRIEPSKKEYGKFKEAARGFAARRLSYLNTFYRFRFGAIAIRNQKSRWGSCSRAGNLSFNYRLLFLPEDLAEYILAHELCHLKEMNHSKRFWSLVARTIPDHIERRRKLRKLERGLLADT